MSHLEGIVRRSTGSWYEVKTSAGETIPCRLKGKFKIKGLKVTNPIAVGDVVYFKLEDTEEKNGVIFDIQPRKNYIIRQSVHKTAHGHLIASNLDQAILIATVNYPKTSLGFIDRFLVTAESFRIPALILFNKIDLLESEDEEELELLMDLYEELGYKCLPISALHKINIDKVHEVLEGKLSLVTGHSGVGKSQLINTIIPDLDLATSEISSFANKGVHTTTFAEMFNVNEETTIIDTPGIKELGLMDMVQTEIGHYFPEIRDLMGECKFNNCIHVNEPKCAIKDAVGEGKIAESRYLSYLSMLENDDNRR
ncbi:ribosome biogenesis GTPase [Spirosomataceae bacterium TFI 002]|nr:ribosome biogenesis GTPase [Spirosomataceae bacterium TFI 002]